MTSKIECLTARLSLLTPHHGKLLCILVLSVHDLGSVHCLLDMLIIIREDTNELSKDTTKWMMEELTSYSLFIFQYERKLAQKSLAKKRQVDNGEVPPALYSLAERKGGGAVLL